MEKLYEGKSKVVYSSEEPGTCIIKYKDTATAGNGVKICPEKENSTRQSPTSSLITS
mgnify:CR=1 FL=1